MDKLSTQLLKRLQQKLFRRKDTCFITYEMLRRTCKHFSEVFPPLKVADLSSTGQRRYTLCKLIRRVSWGNIKYISHDDYPEIHSTGQFLWIRIIAGSSRDMIHGFLHVKDGRFCYEYSQSNVSLEFHGTKNIDVLIQTLEDEFFDHMTITYDEYTTTSRVISQESWTC